MPIVIDRHTGDIIRKPELSYEQNNAALEQILKNWILMNPEKFQALLMDIREENTI